MKKNITVTGVLFLILLCSCKKFLNTEPEDFLSPVNYYETEAELKLALAGVYDVLGQSSMYGNFMISYMGMEADEGFYAKSSITTGLQVNNLSSSDANVLSTWQALYQGISRANMLLANIQKPDMDETKRNAVKGEALFLRSYYYFLLVSMWGDVPLILTPATSATGNDVARTPSAQVYEQIVKDMQEAETLVPTATEVGFGGRVNKSAVRGVLARVFLYWAGYPLQNTAKYEEAKKWADKVIQSKEHELNTSFQQTFINYAQDKYDIKESILEVEFWSNGTSIYTEYGRVGNNNGIITTNETIGYAYGYININARLYKSYENADNRRDWAIAAFKYDNSTGAKTNYTATQIYQRNPGKWRREYELVTPKIKGGTPQNFPLLRYSDVLLMYAEVDNEINGPTTDALNALNTVRSRANATVVKMSALPDKKALRDSIQKERSRELCFEAMRKPDLIRWGIYVETLKAAAAEITADAPSGLKYGALAGNNVTQRDVLLPIPDYERGLNKKLTQNKDW